jgi:single-stranded-DNA-specific exonuclease
MKKIWKINKPAPKEFLDKFPEFQEITLQMLWDRGLKTQKQIDEFFSPDYDEDLYDPFLLKDIKKTLKRIEKAAEKQEKVAIFADYDADGICGAVLLHEILNAYKIEPETYIPDRNTEGYGLNLKAIEEIAKKNVKLILTIDCGVTDFEEVKLANKLGMEVIIVDHHELLKRLPSAFAIINPKQKNCKYPFKQLSATGVAFKIVQAVRITKKLPISWEKWLLDLVAIATITDSMLILGENRTLVKYGMIVLSQTKRLGLKVLMEKTRIKGELSTYALGFIIGPRINAASRVDHGTVAFHLLMTKHRDDAEKLADGLETRNQERQRQMDKIFKEARERAKINLHKRKIIFEADENWTAGLIGLVAQKLRDEFWRPCFICQISKKHAVCSARGGIDGFDVIKALNQCKDLLEEYGGHPFAGAFRADIENLDKIQKSLEKTGNKELTKEELTPFLEIDSEISTNELNWKTFGEIQKFEPFGTDNPKPLFLMRGVKIVGMRNVGTKENHLKLLLEKEYRDGIKRIDAIGFNLVGFCDKIELGNRVDIVFEILANEWNGSRELQLKIVDLRKV